MLDLPMVFMILGGLFLAGLASDEVGRRTRLPRVTLLLLCGLVFGRAGFDLIPEALTNLYEALSVTALTMVAFLLGGVMTRDTLAKHGRVIVSMSLAIVVVTWVVVAAGLWLLGLPLEVAILLGAIATATDPAATQDAIEQAQGKGAFAARLRGIVAIDDAWGMIAFALAVVLARALGGAGFDASLLGEAAREVGLAVLIGVGVGLPGALLTGRLRRGAPLKAEALALVFLTAGLSLWLDASFLISGMVAGAVIVNLASHHDYAFHEIEGFEWPFLILFFILAGASLEPAALAAMGLAGAGYVVLRILARVVGGWAGGAMAGLGVQQKRLFGLALLPQAGVAVGMALVAGDEFPAHAELILTVTIATTVLFEVVGPLVTMQVIRRIARQAGR